MDEFFGGGWYILACIVPAVIFIFLFLVIRGIRIINEYERGIVFTLGKFSGVRNPGLNIIFPLFQRLLVVDMRLKTAEVPRQEVMTKDNISVLVNAVVYFKVIDPESAVIKIEDYQFAIRQYTQAALRDVIGIREGSRKRTYFKELPAYMEDRPPAPEWLDVNEATLEGKVLRAPERRDIDMPLNEQLIVEYYSR